MHNRGSQIWRVRWSRAWGFAQIELYVDHVATAVPLTASKAFINSLSSAVLNKPSGPWGVMLANGASKRRSGATMESTKNLGVKRSPRFPDPCLPH